MSSQTFAPIGARGVLFSLRCTAVLVLTLFGTAPASAAPPALSLDEAQLKAVGRSLQLTAQQRAGSAAREQAIAAGQLPDPVLKAGIDNLPVSGSDRFSVGSDFMTMRRVGVSQEVTRTEKRQWRAARFEREADKADAQRLVATAAIQRDTALAWLEVYYTQLLAGALAQQAALATQEIDAAEAAYRGGRGSRPDLLAARSALLALTDRAAEMRGRLRVAQTRLSRWTGTADDVAVDGLPDIEHIRLDPARLETELLHHPEIAVWNRQEQIAQAEVNLARADRQSDWTVEVAFQQRGSGFSNMLSVGVSMPLQWDRKNRQDRDLAAKLASVEQTKAEREEVLREHVAQTRTMIAEWQSGRERIARYTSQTLPLAAERSQALLAAYRGGKASLADVLAARGGETELRLQAINLQLDTARLWAQLNFLFPADLGQHAARYRSQESQ